MKRRTMFLGAAAVVGAVAGAGTAVWRRADSRDSRESDPTPAVDLWSLSFATLDGGSLPMAGLRGKPLLLNFWATWCAPCVKEMPLLDAFLRERAGAGWQVLALAIDQAEPVRRFAAERALHLPIALAGADGLDLSRSLGNSLGALPFTAVFDASGRSTQRKLGAVDAALLSKWVQSTH
ncbi:MAG: TlpA disulfide reductase family protein [Caldimonas sp.]